MQDLPFIKIVVTSDLRLRYALFKQKYVWFLKDLLLSKWRATIFFLRLLVRLNLKESTLYLMIFTACLSYSNLSNNIGTSAWVHTYDLLRCYPESLKVNTSSCFPLYSESLMPYRFCFSLISYAASSHFYLKHSQNEENGQGNESRFHVKVQRKIL